MAFLFQRICQICIWMCLWNQRSRSLLTLSRQRMDLQVTFYANMCLTNSLNPKIVHRQETPFEHLRDTSSNMANKHGMTSEEFPPSHHSVGAVTVQNVHISAFLPWYSWGITELEGTTGQCLPTVASSVVQRHLPAAWPYPKPQSTPDAYSPVAWPPPPTRSVHICPDAGGQSETGAYHGVHGKILVQQLSWADCAPAIEGWPKQRAPKPSHFRFFNF